MAEASWTPPTEAQLAAADRFTEEILSSLADSKGVNAETAIAAAARLGGTFLFRSFDLNVGDPEPGAVVLSVEANEQGPLLIQTLGAALSAMDADLDNLDMEAEIPEECMPSMSTTEMQAKLEAPFVRIAEKAKLDKVEAAHACAVSAASLILMTAEVLDLSIAFNTAAMGFIEGTKTMPPPLADGESSRKPWYKFW